MLLIQEFVSLSERKMLGKNIMMLYNLVCMNFNKDIGKSRMGSQQTQKDGARYRGILKVKQILILQWEILNFHMMPIKKP